MARIRTVKPELFRHEDLFELELETKLPIRLSFIALFTACDREGRFKWRPRQLKLDCLPYDEIDFSRVLDALITRGFVKKYSVAGVDYGLIPSFTTHQIVNNRESESILPGPNDVELVFQDQTRTEDGLSGKDGFVYLAYAKNANKFKVGFTENEPSRRISDLSTGSPEYLELVEFISDKKAKETLIHRELKDHNSHGEWFFINDESVGIICTHFTRASRVLHATQGEGEREREREGNTTHHSADEKTKPDGNYIPQDAGEWTEFFVNRHGFQFHEAQTAKTIPMYADWVKRGITLAIVESAIVAATSWLKGKGEKGRPDNPGVYEKFVNTVINEQSRLETKNASINPSNKKPKVDSGFSEKYAGIGQSGP